MPFRASPAVACELRPFGCSYSVTALLADSPQILAELGFKFRKNTFHSNNWPREMSDKEGGAPKLTLMKLKVRSKFSKQKVGWK